MPIGISDEHVALRESVARWAQGQVPTAMRAALEADSETRPTFWGDLAAQGWLGLHVPEDRGGAGYGALETAVVVEELGYHATPGPFVPTVLTAALLAESGGAADLVRELVDGATTAAVAIAVDPLRASDDGTTLRLSGEVRPVLGAVSADVLLVSAAIDERSVVWCVARAIDARVRELPSLDPTRRVAEVTFEDAPATVIDGVTSERVLALAAALFAAEAAGLARWCLDTAVAYAKVREQFGRPVGQFQAVKHRCADMLIAVEQATAAAWDAARVAGDAEGARLPVAVAATIALDAAVRCAKDCVQVLGGIGFTWEHDAHVYLRRATSLRQLLGGTSWWRSHVATLALGGTRRRLDLDLAGSGGAERDAVRAFIAELRGLDAAEQRTVLVDEGYLQPHLPRPWGRDAGATEQLVIDEEMRAAGIDRPSLQIGAWVVPTLITYGSTEQQERWLRPTLMGELTWCQMFSEPGAGSDLASLSTKATRVEGGWLLTGQKVWTSLADRADLAITLARTDSEAPKREGITYFVLDMHSEGVDVRPLRELTGHAMFNEVFLSDVFIPDDHVVGGVGRGWVVAKNTLANERVAMATGSSFGGGLEALLAWLGAHDGGPHDALLLDRLGGLLCDGQSLALMGLRTTLRALSGADPGPESSVRKLLGVEHEQRVSELALELLGAEGATLDGDAAGRGAAFLGNRCLTIAGGTSEVQRNVIAERLLGLPRDPEPA